MGIGSQPDNAVLYELAHREAARALSEQQDIIDGLRTRSGLLLSAAAIATSFLGAQALDGGGSGVLVWLAMAGFVGVAVATLVILWPRKWEFTADPRSVIQTYVEADDPASIGEVHRDLALHVYASFVENEKGLAQLTVFFQAASVLLAVEVVLWIVALASTGHHQL